MPADLPDRLVRRRSGHVPAQHLATGPAVLRTADHRRAAPPARPGRARLPRAAVVLVLAAAGTVVLLTRLASAGAAPGAADGLDADLRERFDLAVADAARDGVTLTLTSGWRSPQEQQRLVDDAIERHGSLTEASRWVLPPESSAHVSGLAIDVGPAAGALWLEERSPRYGLCRTYANEGWHFEPVIDPGGTCPAMLEDSSAGWVD